MTALPDLVQRVRALGRIESDARALRWLRAAASTLAEWGGKPAREALEAALPKDLFSGAGTRGCSLAGAQDRAPGVASIALFAELGHRAEQEDPGKMIQMAGPAISLLRAELSPSQLDQLLAALPPDVATEVRDATVEPVWKYGLIPQSYARPAAKAKH